MNKRIEELARKARALATTKDAFEEYVMYLDAEKFEQKFAELLIKECAMLADKAANSDTEFRCMYDVLTEHFGLKE